MSDSIDRRRFIGMSGMAGLAGALAGTPAVAVPPGPGDLPREAAGGTSAPARPILTPANDFVDVSRGKPKPHTLKGEALVAARLTPETWRLEVVGDASAEVARPLQLQNGTALDMAALKELGRTHSVSYLKAMQCNNIPSPLGQGLWEGVPLRELIVRLGNVANVRRVYFSGFHNNDPAQLFQSSLSFNQVMETPPWLPPALVAYRLNGKPIPLERGGPVRMIVPWAHGFKSIKWLERVVLTNDYQANDTYALQNNDPESYLKTAAYLGKGELLFQAGKPIEIEGTAISGWSGLSRVEYWLRQGTGAQGPLPLDDPAWNSAVWHPCKVSAPPDDWETVLPAGTAPGAIWGFDQKTAKPKAWPLAFSTVTWRATLEGLQQGTYEFRARTLDLNGFAQPQPRPYQKSGMNLVPCQRVVVTS
jgi:DMSO/TMAO reductase YedYZ molybdopterin-dependent catalytic subunit